MKTKNIFKLVIFVIALAIIVGLAFILQLLGNVSKPVACTLEAKLCLDGSYVGRVGPKCEFAKCPTPEASGIKGIVLLGPICPVIKNPPEPQCNDKPYQTKLAITNPNGAQVIKEFTSDENGKFSIGLTAGEYAIRTAAAANILPYCSSNGTIKVNANTYTEIIVNCDTGIR